MPAQKLYAGVKLRQIRVVLFHVFSLRLALLVYRRGADGLLRMHRVPLVHGGTVARLIRLFIAGGYVDRYGGNRVQSEFLGGACAGAKLNALRFEEGPVDAFGLQVAALQLQDAEIVRVEERGTGIELRERLGELLQLAGIGRIHRFEEEERGALGLGS